jgi:Fe-S-cluster-containing dehydrogenase component
MKAFEVDKVTGAVIVIKEKCDGCGKCVLACNNHAVHLESPKGPVRICNLCNGEPLCVLMCPTGAISFQEMNDLKRENIAETSRHFTKAWRCSLHDRTSD